MTVIDPFAGTPAVRVKSVQFTTKKGKLVCRINNSSKFPMEAGDDFDYFKDIFVDGDLFVIPNEPDDGKILFKFSTLSTLECSNQTYHLEG